MGFEGRHPLNPFALRHPRLSVDIDRNHVGAPDREEMPTGPQPSSQVTQRAGGHQLGQRSRTNNHSGNSRRGSLPPLVVAVHDYPLVAASATNTPPAWP